MVEITEGPSPVLLYDGLCGFCDGAVQFILRQDPHGSMRFAPLQGDTARDVLARYPELQGVDSLILVEDAGASETAVARSEAVLGVAAYLGGIWSWSALLRIIPRRIRDWGYALFARHRFRFFRRYEECLIPTPEVRERFLP